MCNLRREIIKFIVSIRHVGVGVTNADNICPCVMPDPCPVATFCVNSLTQSWVNRFGVKRLPHRSAP